MTRSKLKKKWKARSAELVEEEKNTPIKGLPEKFLWMKVNGGTKIRNVVGYALKTFPEYGCVLWSGAGQGIGKVISCAEIFKRNNSHLHQVTKLRYIDCEKDSTKYGKEQIPEINIFLSKSALDSTETGYQRPGDIGMFQTTSTNPSNYTQCQGGKSRMSSMMTEEFAAMELPMGQKRSRKDQPDNNTPSKMSKMHDSPRANVKMLN